MQAKTFDYKQPHLTPWHEHESGQLYWLSDGVIVIETSRAQWTVTPGSVGWFPASLKHKAWVPATVSGRSLYLDPASSTALPSLPGIYGADSFILGLLERVFSEKNAPTSDNYRNNLLTLLGHEIARSDELPLHLTFPVDRRARNVANALLNNPGGAWDQAQLAKQWGLSVRSLSRLFRLQTGLSFSQWRQQAKIIVSLRWVLAGLSISDVAMMSGYSNVSAYIEAFRQRFGQTPGQLQARKVVR
ncbi:transcriptional regulator [Lonsdalea iberica]|uniref:Transcriptional regulator n=1 Tax=Lonsdalea iberica TaxID=1082703 RepID=A0ABX3XFA2_9GAMM|nr:helix-turn-helix transcriptional regulator [Lonsdalea iberica]OSN10245.1 transcriptional regulator [Lonsdalea iberica]